MVEKEYQNKIERINLPRHQYPILNNVSTAKGEYVGKNEVEDILNHQISVRDIYGPPIAGKSTFLNGIATAVGDNASRLGIDIQIKKVLYEDILERFKNETEEGNLALPPLLEGPEFNQRFCEEVDDTVEKALDSNKRTLILIENPGVGKTHIKDRCVTGNDYVLRKYMAQGVEGVNAKAFALLPERGLEARGALIRTMITKNDELTGKPFLEDNEIQEYLARQGIILQTNANFPSSEVGRKVREIMQKAATKEQTDSIFNEEVELLKDFQSKLNSEDRSRIDKIIAPSYLSSAKLLMSAATDGQKFEGYNEFVKRRAKAIQEYEKQWAYFYQHRMDQKGVPPDKGLVLFNPYLPDTKLYLKI
jgi:hypothetical protein